jgi:hypothetical protein
VPPGMHGDSRHARPLLVGTALRMSNNYALRCMEIAVLCMVPDGDSTEGAGRTPDRARRTGRRVTGRLPPGARPGSRAGEAFHGFAGVGGLHGFGGASEAYSSEFRPAVGHTQGPAAPGPSTARAGFCRRQPPMLYRCASPRAAAANPEVTARVGSARARLDATRLASVGERDKTAAASTWTRRTLKP